MKLKFLILSLFCFCLATNSYAKDPGLRFIKSRGEILCGTDLSTKSHAFKDEGGFWRGIDADFCRVFSLAVFGNAERFKLVHVPASQVDTALKTNKIDVMLGDVPGTATKDVSGLATQAGLLYYTRQLLLAHQVAGATSMEDFKGKKICLVMGTDDYYNMKDFSDKYKLDLRPLFFRTKDKAKEAFLLKRCDLYSGSELYLKNILNQIDNPNLPLEILPEVIAEKPVYVYVDKNNQGLRLALKWIINALNLAEKQNISSQNVDIFIGLENGSIKNLLGENPELWQKFGLVPNWVKLALKQFGNYGEIFEKNLGSGSEFFIDRGKNKLIQDGGVLDAQAFY